MHKLAALNHRHMWHPFTQMRDWLRREPIIIASGEGAVLRDVRGREFLDANSSIWTNLHGHRHPRIDRAIRCQLEKIAHSSALGLANEPATRLAAQLVQAATLDGSAKNQLSKVFFSDDGSTAMEVCLKLAYETSLRTGRSRPRFLTLQEAYHGDTIGAVSLGHIPLFHQRYRGLVFKTDQIMAPYCYRCPFNKAKPERADARDYRRCQWECVRELEQKFAIPSRSQSPYAAFVFEPLIQGAAGMIPQPRGWLRRVSEIARAAGALLVADEVMTAFGRTGSPPGSGLVSNSSSSPGGAVDDPWFACHHEEVQPDLAAVAKGLTGGYLPMAATLTTESIFNLFLGDYAEFKTFFHGHSYTANQLGAAAALANLQILRSHQSRVQRWKLEEALAEALPALWSLPQVGDIRQVGLIAGIELVRDWKKRAPFHLRERMGIRVCEAMASRGVLTRPIGNVIVLMPPYCTTPKQLRQMVQALHDSVAALRGC